jgi:hypothetical protein
MAMFNSWFGKEDVADLPLSGSEKNGSGNHRPAENGEQPRRTGEQPPAAADRAEGKPPAPVFPPTFEQIYSSAAVKPPKLTYGIQKVADMSASSHLAGMSPLFKRKALLMALEAVGADIGQILNEVVTRQRALKEYEDAYQEKVSQFEQAQAEQHRQQQAELEKIIGQFKARAQAGSDEVARRRDEFRTWQKSKQNELQRLMEAAAFCVPQEELEQDEQPSDGKVTAILQKAAGAYR